LIVSTTVQIENLTMFGLSPYGSLSTPRCAPRREVAESQVQSLNAWRLEEVRLAEVERPD